MMIMHQCPRRYVSFPFRCGIFSYTKIMYIDTYCIYFQSVDTQGAIAGDVASIDAVRIAIGKKVFRAKCLLSFQFGTKSPYIQFSFENKGKTSEHRVYLKNDDLKEVKYHIPDELDNSDEDDEDSMTVIAFRITPTEINNLEKYSSSYKQDESDDEKNSHKRYISVEVRDADDFKVRTV